MGIKAEERTAARDFVMARLAALRGALAEATLRVDMVLANFLDPDRDNKGKHRAQMLEEIDESIGAAARAVQAAQSVFDEIDPAEGEPDLEDDEDDEDDDDDDDDDDED